MQRLSQGCSRPACAAGGACTWICSFPPGMPFLPGEPLPAGGLSQWNELCEQREFGAGVTIPAARPGQVTSASACLCWSQVHPRTGEAWRRCRNHEYPSLCSPSPVWLGCSCCHLVQLPLDVTDILVSTAARSTLLWLRIMPCGCSDVGLGFPNKEFVWVQN